MVSEGMHDKMYDPKEYLDKPGSQMYLLERFILLYYAGREVEAKTLIEKIKFPEESVEEYHSDFVKRLKTSPFYQDVRAVNHGSL